MQEWAKISSASLRQNFNTSSTEYTAITNYKKLTTMQNDIARTTFKCTGFDYDTNGRIKTMSYIEN